MPETNRTNASAPNKIKTAVNMPKPSEFAPLQIPEHKIKDRLAKLEQLTQEQQINTLEEIHNELSKMLERVKI